MDQKTGEKPVPAETANRDTTLVCRVVNLSSALPLQPLIVPEPTPLPPQRSMVLPEPKPLPPQRPVVLPEPKPLPPQRSVVLPEPKPLPPQRSVVLPEPKPLPPQRSVVLPEPKPDPLPVRPIEKPDPPPRPPQGLEIPPYVIICQTDGADGADGTDGADGADGSDGADTIDTTQPEQPPAPTGQLVPPPNLAPMVSEPSPLTPFTQTAPQPGNDQPFLSLVPIVSALNRILTRLELMHSTLLKPDFSNWPPLAVVCAGGGGNGGDGNATGLGSSSWFGRTHAATDRFTGSLGRTYDYIAQQEGPMRMAGDYQENFNRFANRASMGQDEAEALRRQLIDDAQEAGETPIKVLAAYEIAYLQMGKRGEEARQAALSIANGATAASMEADDFSTYTEQSRRAFGISADQNNATVDLLAQADSTSDIRAHELAQNPVQIQAAQAASAYGLNGVNGLQSMLSTEHVLKRMLGSVDEAVGASRTLFTQLQLDQATGYQPVAGLNLQSIMTNAANAGGNPFDAVIEAIDAQTDGVGLRTEAENYASANKTDLATAMQEVLKERKIQLSQDPETHRMMAGLMAQSQDYNQISGQLSNSDGAASRISQQRDTEINRTLDVTQNAKATATSAYGAGLGEYGLPLLKKFQSISYDVSQFLTDNPIVSAGAFGVGLAHKAWDNVVSAADLVGEAFGIGSNDKTTNQDGSGDDGESEDEILETADAEDSEQGSDRSNKRSLVDRFMDLFGGDGGIGEENQALGNNKRRLGALLEMMGEGGGGGGSSGGGDSGSSGFRKAMESIGKLFSKLRIPKGKAGLFAIIALLGIIAGGILLLTRDKSPDKTAENTTESDGAAGSDAPTSPDGDPAALPDPQQVGALAPDLQEALSMASAALPGNSLAGSTINATFNIQANPNTDNQDLAGMIVAEFQRLMAEEEATSRAKLA